jgi:hypothetical protein
VTPECALFQSAAFRNPSQGLLYLGASVRFCAGGQPPPDIREPGEMGGFDPSVTEITPFNLHIRGNGCDVRMPSSCQPVPYFGLRYHLVSAGKFGLLFECLEKADSAAQFQLLFEATLPIYLIVGGNLWGSWGRLFKRLRNQEVVPIPAMVEMIFERCEVTSELITRTSGCLP